MIDNDNEMINDIFRRFTDLSSFRAIREGTWDDIIEWSDPDGGYVQTKEDRGNLRTEHIYDSTANKNLTRLAATLNSMLTGQFSKWFQVETTDKDFNKDTAGKEWLEEVSDILLGVFDNSNFYVEVFKFYYDLCNIGTSTMYIEDDDDVNKEVRFSTRHIREIYIDENKYGDIDTVFRKFEMSIRQMVQRWGLEKLSKETKQSYEKSPDKKVSILHCVYPRNDYDIDRKDSKNMPYTSYWFEFNSKHLINESGYSELPYSVARWFTPTGETYGRSPMYIALPDVRSLNRLMKITIEGSEFAIRPPLKGTPDLSDHQDIIDIESGKVIIYDPALQGNLQPIWEQRMTNDTQVTIQSFREQITDVLLGNQLQTVDRTQMTAEEVRARTAENAKVIGPTFGRIQSEFLEKLIERVYNIVLRQVDANGAPKIPEPPVKPEGELKIRFVSPLAKAQRNNQIQGIMALIQWSMGVANVRPDILDNIDFDEALRIFADINDAPAEVVRDPKLVNQERRMKQMQQQQMQQQQMDMMQKQAQAENVNKLAGAGKAAAESEKIKE